MDMATLCYWGLLIILIIGLFYSVFKLFEKSKPTVENIVIIALLIAIAIIGTLPTAAVPSLQIASFIIIMTGIVFGRQTGFITGVLTPVVIGLFSGLGFWTLFQMLGFGLMGLTAGILAPKLENNTYLRAAFGFMWGLLYGWITNISMFPFLQEINMGTIIGVYASSLVFDLMHGIVTAILLVALFGTFKRIFSRAKENYFN